MQHVKAKLRVCAGFEFVCAMACADCDSQGVTACLFNKLRYFLRTGIRGIFSRYLYIVFHACQCAKFSFHYYTVFMRILYHPLCDLDILFKGFGRSINHNGSKSAVDTGLTCLKIRTVI